MKSGKNVYDVGNGIHRVPTWRIAGYALNNTATNLYMFMMMFVSYFITGWVGLSVVMAGSFAMIMRIWDGVTDPFIGYFVDKTDGKFGKNRPFMVIGNIILLISSYIMFFVTPNIESNSARVAFFIIMNLVYYIGYTFQCVVTKSAQTCVTNDPKQRPLFSMFDTIYNMCLFIGFQILTSKYLVPKYGGFNKDVALYHELWWITAITSIVFTIIAVISIAPKDVKKYYGTGNGQMITFKDYKEILKENKAIRMLVLSASTDKLGTSAKTSAVTVILFGILAGNYELSGMFTLYSTIGSIVIVILGIKMLAARYGQRKAMIVSSWAALLGNIALILLWTFGDATSLNLPGVAGFDGFTAFTILFLILGIFTAGFQGIAGGIVIPMTADCADYETYRSGRYVPGLMGTIFSFVDKIVSSFAPFVANLCFALIGFKEVLPDVDTPATPQLKFVGIFLTYGLISLGLIVNLLAMKNYPLTAEMMTEIREANAKRKEELA